MTAASEFETLCAEQLRDYFGQPNTPHTRENLRHALEDAVRKRLPVTLEAITIGKDTYGSGSQLLITFVYITPENQRRSVVVPCQL